MNANVARSAFRAATRSSATRRGVAGAARSLSIAATARPSLTKMVSAAAKPATLTRGLKTIEFTEGIPEKVYEREDWPLEKLQDYFKGETFAILGYGSQGHGQGLK